MDALAEIDRLKSDLATAYGRINTLAVENNTLRFESERRTNDARKLFERNERLAERIKELEQQQSRDQ